MGTVILEYNLGNALKSEYEKLPKNLKYKPPGIAKLEISGDVAKALNESKDHDLAVSKIQAKGTKLCDETVKELKGLLAELADELEFTNDQKIRQGQVNTCGKNMEKVVKELEDKLEKLPEIQWKKFLVKYGEAKKEYKKYKVAAASDIALGTLGVVGSSVAVAGAAHTGGVSLALGIVGLVRSVATIANTVHKIAIDVEKYATEISKDIQAMANDFKNSKAQATGKDLAKTAVNTILGSGFATTVSTVEGKTEALGGKLAGAFVGGVKLSRKVTESLNKMEEYEKKLGTTPDSKKVQAKLEKLEGNFGKLFDLAADMNAKVKRVKQLLKAIKESLKILKQETAALAAFEKAIDILVKVGLATAGAATGFAEAGGKTIEFVKTSTSLANDVVSTAKDAKDAI